MPKYAAETPVALIVNPDCVGAFEIKNKFTSLGIAIETCSELECTTATLSAYSYIAWFSKQPEASKKIFSQLNLGAISGLKVMLVLGLDYIAGKPDPTVVDSRFPAAIIHELHHLGFEKGIDFRLVCHLGLWSEGSRQGSASIARIIDNLSHGRLSLPKNKQIYPSEVSQSLDTLFSFWFDRGHRGQTLQLDGSPINSTELQQKLCQKEPHLEIVSDSWMVGEGIPEIERVTAATSADDLVGFLSSFINIPVSLPPSPVPAPPSIPSLPKRGKQQSPSGWKLPFETVVLSSDQVKPTFPPPIVPAVEQGREVKKNASASSAPQLPRRLTLSKLTVSVPYISRLKSKGWLTFLVLVCLLSFSLVVIPLGFLYFSLHQADRVSPDSTPAVISSRQKNLDRISKYTDKMIDLVAPLPFMSTLQQRLDQLEAAAVERFLVAKAQIELADAAKLMVTATAGDPYISLEEAKYTLNELYVYQSTHNLTNSANRQWVVGARQAVDLLPRLIPADKKITVLVLLQNNLELRPTGGFVGAVALLTFDHGKLLNSDTRDIYDLDSNLKGLVNPPPELKTYLGESSWFFRDANWSPDFLDTAGTSNWFLEKEWGSPADVIVGINLNTFKTLLTANGPLTLPDGQIIESDNLLVTAFNHQDVPVVKPDAKKQEFMSLFIKPLVDQLSQSKTSQVSALLNALGQAVAANEVSLATTNSTVLRELVDNGWAGTVIRPVCPSNFTTPCWGDLFYLNEANVGINKSNYYMQRVINHTLSLTASEANHLHTVQYSNTSPTDTWPGGSYKSYLRLYLPQEATGLTLTANGSPVSYTVLPAVTGASFQTLGFFLEIKPQSSLSLDIKYSVPHPASYQSYVFALQKQPGVSSDQFTLALTPPVGRSLSKTSLAAPPHAPLTLSGNLDQNQVVALEFNP